MVVAKMKCISKETIERGPSYVDRKVRFQAVVDTVNKEWAAATPSGTIEMTIGNVAAFDAFEAGEDYLVRFEVAPKHPKEG